MNKAADVIVANSEDGQRVNDENIEGEEDSHNGAIGLDLDDDSFKLPEMDWDSLEAKLKQAHQEVSIQNQRANMNSIGPDRDEIRRKLASTVVSSSSSMSSSSYEQQQGLDGNTTNTTSGLHHHIKPGHNLQICFMNDPSVLDEEGDDGECEEEEENEDELFPLDHSSVEDCNYDLPVKKGGAASAASAVVSKKSNNNNHVPISLSNFSVDFICSNESWNTILAQLQYETKQLMANVPNQVKLRVEAEIASSKKVSPIADIVGLPTYGLKKLEQSHLVDMNIGQLQVIVNDLCNQIENINEELKMMLVDRDDYYMQQDSLLVDVEDEIKRIHEFEAKHRADKKKSGASKSSTDTESGSGGGGGKQQNGRVSFSSSIQEIAGKASAYLPNGSSLMAKGSSSGKAASKFFQLFQQKTSK